MKKKALTLCVATILGLSSGTVGIRKMILETWYYEVVSIDGDYANLRRTDADSPELKLVARALLPAEIKEGTKLKYEMMQYEVIG